MNEEHRRARTIRLELILLGMALAKTGDRDEILDVMRFESTTSPAIGECFSSIADSDVEGVVDYLRGIGVERLAGEPVMRSVLRSVVDRNRSDTLRRELMRIAEDGSSEEIIRTKLQEIVA